MSSIYDALKRSQADKQRSFPLGSMGSTPAKKWYWVILAAVLFSSVCTMAVLYGVGLLSASPEKPGVKGPHVASVSPQARIPQAPAAQPIQQVQPAPVVQPARKIQPTSEVDQDRIWDLIKKADKLHQKGDLQGAIEIYTELTAITPSFIEMYIRLGGLYYEAKQYDKALDIYMRALKTAPNNAKLLNNIGSVLLTKNEAEKALKYFIQAHRNSNDYVEPLYNMACAYTRLRKNGAALSSLRQACIMQPEARLWAKRDPDLQPLRSEKEFATIVHGSN
jgi:tetratricopeptide (TPR) repeat protein